MAAQLLAPGLHREKVEDVVSYMLAMQGQQVYSFPHAVIIRSQNANFFDVKAAFENRSLVRHRPMRGTVHITHARDYHWLRLALNTQPSSFTNRFEADYGITESSFQKAANLAYDLLPHYGGGISRKKIFAAWQEAFAAQIGLQRNATRFCNLLMWGLDRRGLLVEGPIRKNEHLFIDARTLPAADSSESGFYFHNEMPREIALIELAYRYVRGHGPISVDDLARWASIKKTTASQVLEANVRNGKLARYQINEQGLLTKWRKSDPIRYAYYMEPHLFSVVEERRAEIIQTWFLPAFDELHVGYENRTCLTDEVGENLICPAKNGMFKPIVVQAGRLVAVYSKDGILIPGSLTSSQLESVKRVIAVTQARLCRE